MSHSLFSPSAAHRWIPCPGSMAFPANQEQGGSSKYADDGTASHNLASRTLMTNEDCSYFLDTVSEINGVTYTNDEERCDRIQTYVDDVRRRAIGGILFVEYHVDLSKYLGEGQGGTGDAVIVLPKLKTLIVEDLKDGSGERVDASYMVDGVEKPNQQLGLYGLGALEDAKLLGYEIEKVILVINQPKLGHLSEATFTPAQLTYLADDAVNAVKRAGEAMILSTTDPRLAKYLTPGTKTCRWCRVQATCPSLAKFVADEVRADFDTIEADPPPQASNDARMLSRASIAVPLIEQWCKSVRSAIHENVSNGVEIIGSDGLPFKFVEGEQGNRKWLNEDDATAALLGQLGPEKAYAPAKIITAPAAAKLLDKKLTKALWTDIFAPLIGRAPGKAVLALGSDTRPPYTGGADANEFDELGANE